MKKNNIVLVVIAVVTLLSFMSFATYAYFASNASVSNVTNLNVTSERNNMVFDVVGGGMLLNVTAANMTQAGAGSTASENNTTLTVSFQANTEYSMVCSYDIVYEWTSQDKYQSHTSGVTSNEFTIGAILDNNEHVYEGDNRIKIEQDLSTIVSNQASATVVSGAQIDSTGTSTSTAVWNLTGKFYNVNANQNGLADKTYEGRFKVTNVSCQRGQSEKLAYWFDTTTCTYDNRCTHPNYGGTLQSSGIATGHSVYVGQDSNKYYACATINGHEICLSQPYTQYGLSGHTVGNDLTSTEQINAKQAIYKAFIDAGISVDINSDCGADGDDAYCVVGDINVGVDYKGAIYCLADDTDLYCEVNPDGSVYCELW